MLKWNSELCQQLQTAPPHRNLLAALINRSLFAIQSSKLPVRNLLVCRAVSDLIERKNSNTSSCIGNSNNHLSGSQLCTALDEAESLSLLSPLFLECLACSVVSSGKSKRTFFTCLEEFGLGQPGGDKMQASDSASVESACCPREEGVGGPMSKSSCSGNNMRVLLKWFYPSKYRPQNKFSFAAYNKWANAMEAEAYFFLKAKSDVISEDDITNAALRSICDYFKISSFSEKRGSGAKITNPPSLDRDRQPSQIVLPKSSNEGNCINGKGYFIKRVLNPSLNSARSVSVDSNTSHRYPPAELILHNAWRSHQPRALLKAGNVRSKSPENCSDSLSHQSSTPDSDDLWEMGSSVLEGFAKAVGEQGSHRNLLRTLESQLGKGTNLRPSPTRFIKTNQELVESLKRIEIARRRFNPNKGDPQIAFPLFIDAEFTQARFSPTIGILQLAYISPSRRVDPAAENKNTGSNNSNSNSNNPAYSVKVIIIDVQSLMWQEELDKFNTNSTPPQIGNVRRIRGGGGKTRKITSAAVLLHRFIFNNPKMITVFHAGRTDVALLRQHLGVHPFLTLMNKERGHSKAKGHQMIASAFYDTCIAESQLKLLMWREIEKVGSSLRPSISFSQKVPLVNIDSTVTPKEVEASSASTTTGTNINHAKRTTVISKEADAMLPPPIIGQSVGLAALLQNYQCGGLKDATQQVQDWSRRPLPPDALAYAANDVRYLPLIFIKQLNILSFVHKGNKDDDESVIMEALRAALMKIHGGDNRSLVADLDGYVKAQLDLAEVLEKFYFGQQKQTSRFSNFKKLFNTKIVAIFTADTKDKWVEALFEKISTAEGQPITGKERSPKMKQNIQQFRTSIGNTLQKLQRNIISVAISILQNGDRKKPTGLLEPNSLKEIVLQGTSMWRPQSIIDELTRTEKHESKGADAAVVGGDRTIGSLSAMVSASDVYRQPSLDTLVSWADLMAATVVKRRTQFGSAREQTIPIVVIDQEQTDSTITTGEGADEPPATAPVSPGSKAHHVVRLLAKSVTTKQFDDKGGVPESSTENSSATELFLVRRHNEVLRVTFNMPNSKEINALYPHIPSVAEMIGGTETAHHGQANPEPLNLTKRLLVNTFAQLCLAKSVHFFFATFSALFNFPPMSKGVWWKMNRDTNHNGATHSPFAFPSMGARAFDLHYKHAADLATFIFDAMLSSRTDVGRSEEGRTALLSPEDAYRALRSLRSLVEPVGADSGIDAIRACSKILIFIVERALQYAQSTLWTACATSLSRPPQSNSAATKTPTPKQDSGKSDES